MTTLIGIGIAVLLSLISALLGVIISNGKRHRESIEKKFDQMLATHTMFIEEMGEMKDEISKAYTELARHDVRIDHLEKDA